MDKLEQLYNKNKLITSYVKLYRLAKDEGINVSFNDVKNFLENRNQAFRTTQKDKIQQSIVARDVGTNLMIDVMIYDRYKYGNYEYVLTAVDIKSRYADAIPMTKNSIQKAIDAMDKIFEDMGNVPQILQADNQFNNQRFMDAMRKRGVEQFWFSVAGDYNHNGIVERFNGTLARQLQKWRVKTGLKDWVSAMPEVLKSYNESWHSTIKAKPIDVWTRVDINKQYVIEMEDNWEIGDIVRYKIQKKSAFDKGDRIQYSIDKYEIVKKEGRRWILKNIETGDILKKSFRPSDLIDASKAIDDTIEITKETVKQQKIHDKAQIEKKTRKEKKQLENVGAVSSFDKGVQQINMENNVRQLRSRAVKLPPAFQRVVNDINKNRAELTKTFFDS